MKPLSIMLSMLVIGFTSNAVMAEGANTLSASLPNVSPANIDLVNRGPMGEVVAHSTRYLKDVAQLRHANPPSYDPSK